MKKAIVGVVVVLALAAAGMPFINGILMERGFRQLVADANTMYTSQGADISAEIVRYDRGFSSSEIEWKLHLGSMKSVYKIEEIVFLERAKHGYGSVVSTTSLEKNSWFTDFVGEKLGGKVPMVMTTEYMLTKGIRSVFSLQPFAMEVETETINFKPGELVFEFDWDLKNFRSNGTWDGLTVSDKMEMAGMAMEADLKLITSFIWDGQVSARIDSMTIHDQELALEMKNLKLAESLKYDEKKHAMAFEVSYGAGSISDGEEKIENAFAAIGARGVDSAAYEEAMKFYMELARSMMEEIGAAGDDQEKLKAVMEEKMSSISLQMVPILEKFLKKDLEIYVHDLHTQLKEGEIRGEILLRLEQDLAFSQMLPMMGTPEQIFEFISLKSDLQLPASLVGDNPMLLQPVYPGMTTGLFIAKGTDLVHQAETREKQLFINGEQLKFN